MTTKTEVPAKADFSAEMAEWIEAFDDVVAEEWENGAELLKALRQRAREAGVPCRARWRRRIGNTIPKHDEVPYPGDRKLEKRVEALIRWNAMAMVHGQNKKDAGDWRAYFDVLVAGDAAGGGVQPLLPREVYCGRWERAAGRFYLLPGACFAGGVCAGVSAGTVE